MREHITAGLVAFVVACVPGAYVLMHKPAPTVIAPKTVIIARGDVGGSSVTSRLSTDHSTQVISQVQIPLTRSEQRKLAASWGELDQKEIDAITAAVNTISDKHDLVIFCWRDDLCGDMQHDFENALESAHWSPKLETPLIDDTIGIATNRDDLRAAINEATAGRLDVKPIAKNAPYDVLVIGKKG